MNLNSVADLISCPICLEIPSGSIFLCQTGHSICENCRKKITHCGLCNALMTDTKNFLAQDLAQKIKVPCKYASFGCTKEISGVERESHNNLCEFRSILCPLPLKSGDPCGKHFRLEDYVHHILDDPLHNVKSIEKASRKNYVTQRIPLELTKKTKITQADLPPILHWKNDGVDFLLFTGTFNKITPYWTLFAVPSKTDTKEYWATITVRHPVTGVDWSFRSPCNSIQSSLVDITHSGMCLEISKNSFAQAHRFDEKKNSVEWTLCVTFDESIIGNNINSKPFSTSPKVKPEVPPVVQAVSKVIPIPEVNPQLQLFPSEPSRPTSSAGSSTSSSSLAKGVSTYEAPWPYSNDPKKIIHIGTHTNFKKKCGSGVCIITGKNKTPLYSTCLFHYTDAKSKSITEVELEARSAIKINQSFKKLFTSGSTVFFSSPKDISKSGDVPGSFQFTFHVQLEDLKRSRADFRLTFKDYNPNELESVAARLLLESKTLCNNVLRGSGAKDLSDFLES